MWIIHTFPVPCEVGKLEESTDKRSENQWKTFHRTAIVRYCRGKFFTLLEQQHFQTGHLNPCLLPELFCLFKFSLHILPTFPLQWHLDNQGFSNKLTEQAGIISF